ncbi:MAG: acylphosphatase [Pseudomonadales bacterium]|nr:acylphosphatase [Pseudomonadales bacterium]
MFTIHGFVSGRVQGVGFRYFVKQQAQAQQLTGFAKNLSDGRVEFLLQGEEPAIQNVIMKIHKGPTLSRVDDVIVENTQDTETHTRFNIG